MIFLLSLVKSARYSRAERRFDAEFVGGFRVRVERVEPSATPTIPPAPRGIVETTGAEVIDLASRRSAA